MGQTTNCKTRPKYDRKKKGNEHEMYENTETVANSAR